MAPTRRPSSRAPSSKITFRIAAIACVVAAGCSGARQTPPGRGAPAGAAAGAASSASSSATASAVAPDTRVIAGFECAKAAEILDTCKAGDRTLAALEAAIVCAPPPSAPAPGAARPAGARWDHTSVPQYLDRVERRFGLSANERERLFADGVVVPERLEYPGYVNAFTDVYRSELPLYFSTDALLHSVYASNDAVISTIEASDLSPTLQRVLASMHAQLTTAMPRYAPDTARDLDLYLTVARSLLDNDAVPAVMGTDAEARALVASANAAGGLKRVSLFGRDRMVDFGAYRPRGHYASAAASKNPTGDDLSHYFRAAMWLSRTEMNLVSRSSRSSSAELDPSETPREASLAMALADLAAQAGALEEIETMDEAWAAFAGRREDVSIKDLVTLVRDAGISNVASPDAPAKLRAAIGNDFVRSARTHFQMEPSPELPVIATMLGPRITADASATRPLVHPVVPSRFEVPAVEMAYALGHDRALAHLQKDLTAFPSLRAQLDRSRAVASGTSTWDGAKAPPRGEEHDLYSAWFTAIRGLAATPAGALPSFMETEAFRDMRVASAVAAYGQIRHNYVLMVPMTYDEGGCEIPDGYVEPAPAVYEALIAYAERGEQVMRRLRQPDTYFSRLGRLLRVLSRIADRELANEPLRDEEKRFLSMVAEEVTWRANGYSADPTYAGWFYDLHLSPAQALEDARMVADFFGSVNTGTVDYAGVEGVRMGLFVVDTGGGPRVAVGPVTRAFQARGGMGNRFSDDDVGRFSTQAPWSKSYTSKKVVEPSFTLRTAPSEASADIVLEATSTTNVGPVTIALLDHHRVPIASLTRDLRGSPGKPAKAQFAFQDFDVKDADIARFGVEGIHVSAGDVHFIDADVKQYQLEAGEERWDFGPGKTHPPRPTRGAHPTGRGKRY